MRIFEITLTFFLGLCIILPPIIQPRWLLWLAISAFGTMGVHLGIEGYRWQMLPIYTLTLWNLFFSLYILKKTTNKESLAPNAVLPKILARLGLLGLAVFPPILLPVPRLPEPTGPFKVGTMSTLLIDNNREEIYSGIAGQPRRIMVQVWYPVEIEENIKPAPWMEHMEVMAPAIANYLNLPDFFLDHIRYSQSNAYPNQPINSSLNRYPILLFSHGWNGFRAQNTFQIEELASHGYVVIAPDHAYGAVAMVLPDGKVVLNNPSALPTGMGLPDNEFMDAARMLGNQWAGDLGFILDYLNQPTSGDPLGILVGHLDFDQIGILGHSTGGGAAIQFCGQDSRCQVVLGMDPYLDPVSQNILENGLDVPLLAMFSEAWWLRGGENAQQFNLIQNHQVAKVYQLWIEGTAHYDFTDLPAFSPLAEALGLKGPINGPSALRIINEYTLAYFNTYLLGEKGLPLGIPSKNYPEVHWVEE